MRAIPNLPWAVLPTVEGSGKPGQLHYGDNEGFCAALGHAGVAWVLAVGPRKGTWAPAEQVHTPQEAARRLGWVGPSSAGTGPR